MKLIIIKECERPYSTRNYKEGEYAEVTPELGAQMIADGVAKECNWVYDKNQNPVEYRQAEKVQPIIGEKRKHGSPKRTNNNRGRA